MDEKKRKEIIDTISNMKIWSSDTMPSYYIYPLNKAIDLTEKAAAEEIFKEMDRLGEIWDVPFVNGKDYNELKKKFGVE